MPEPGAEASASSPADESPGPTRPPHGEDGDETAGILREARASDDLRRALNAHAIVAVTDRAGRILEVNDRFCEISKYSRDELLGQDHRVLNSGYHSRDFFRDLWTTISAGEIWRGEIRNRAKDGTFYWVETTIVPFRSPTGSIRRFVALRTDITEAKRADDALWASREELRQLNGRLIQGREDERTHLSREVHDGLGQILTGLKMDLRWIEKRLVGTPTPEQLEGVRSRLGECKELIDGAIGRVQAIATELRPGSLDALGLPDAIREEVRRFQERTGLVFRLSLDHPQTRLPTAASTALFRIFQELLTNIARHARATEVTVRLAHDTGADVLEVQDNGVGFPPSVLSRRTSLGLLGIKERAAALGGDVEFRSAPAAGARVSIRIPRPSRTEPPA
ncbi:MAG: PAS domain S-box protein [Verrucomicrobiales bacterium]|nr:PAS domain S-box protein [Verrucomicrobiales bacterium]